MFKFGLPQLIAPISQDVFLNDHWTTAPLFVPAVDHKLDGLLDRPSLQSIESLIDGRLLKVRACLPDFDDEYSSIQLEPRDALKAFRNNMTLVFDSMQSQDSVIAGILHQIRADLGLVTGGAENNLCRARSIAYATPAGGGTRLHFDANANFIVQVHGTKRWSLAPNDSVKNPTERFTAGADEMPAALEKQCHAPLLAELPYDCTEYLMEPGCVLFVPRGYWHATTTDEDSFSLNFTFSQPSWADILTKSLQEWLLNSSQWRALADGLDSTDPMRKEKALDHFEHLVKQLSEELPDISGIDLLRESGLF